MMRSSEEFASVTVIIPCYRCVNTISRALDSVARQSVKPKEVILIDDASNDNTLERLRVLQRDLPLNIKLIELKENLGAASARNAGWNIATQPYLAFLDADDSWDTKKLEIQYNFMKRNPDVVLSGHLFKNYSDPPNFGEDVLQGRAFCESVSWWKVLIKNPFITPSVMIKSSSPHRFSDGARYMEDHLLWIIISYVTGSVVRLNVCLAATHKHSYGSSGLSSNLWAMERSELSNYKHLHSIGMVNNFQCYMLQMLSLLKYAKRLFVVYIIRPLFNLNS